MNINKQSQVSGSKASSATGRAAQQKNRVQIASASAAKPMLHKLYHGTTESAANSIKANGFKMSLKGGGLQQFCHPEYARDIIDASAKHHYFTKDKSFALGVAKDCAQASGEAQKNLKLELTSEEITLLGFENDPDYGPTKGVAYRTKQDIPGALVKDASPPSSP